MLRGFNYLLYDFIDLFCDVFGIIERSASKLMRLFNVLFIGPVAIV